MRVRPPSTLRRFTVAVLPAPVTAWWDRRGHFAQHVLINLVLGIVIELGIHGLSDLPIIQRAEDAGIDRTIAFFGARGGDRTREPWLAFTVIDVDEAAWRIWGRPQVTPRAKLLRLLEYATTARAAAVVLDIDITRPEGGNGLAPSPDDSALARFLAAYEGATPLVLVQPIEDSLMASVPRHAYPHPAVPWFEPGLGTGPSIHWGTVQYPQEPDGMIRRWRLWETVCGGTATAERVLPSVQLMVAALLEGGAERLSPVLDRVGAAECGRGAEPAPAGEETVLWGHAVEPGSEAVPQRIVYSLRWPPEAGPTRQARLMDGRVVPMLVRLRATDVTEAIGSLDTGALAGRVVVIGGSYAGSRDWYATPLGDMPGMMIVTNAIASLRSHGQLHRSHGPMAWLVTGLLLVLASLAYARFHPLVASLVLMPVIYLIVAPISFYVFQAGAWLNFTAPLLGAQVHELIALAEDAWAARGLRGHPA